MSIQEGSLVNIVRAVESHTEGWWNAWTPEMNGFVKNGKEYIVDTRVSNSTGVRLKDAETDKRIAYSWPVTALQLAAVEVSEPVINVRVGSQVEVGTAGFDGFREGTILKVVAIEKGIVTGDIVGYSAKSGRSKDQLNIAGEQRSFRVSIPLNHLTKPTDKIEFKVSNVEKDDVIRIENDSNVYFGHVISQDKTRAYVDLFGNRGQTYGLYYVPLNQITTVGNCKNRVFTREIYNEMKSKFRKNLNSMNSKFDCETRHTNPIIKKRYKIRGEKLATIIHNKDLKDLVEFLNDLNAASTSVARRFAQIIRNKVEENGFNQCSQCNKWEIDENMEHVDGYEVCDSCVSEMCTFSDLMGRYIFNSHKIMYYESEEAYENNEGQAATEEYVRGELEAYGNGGGEFFPREVYASLGFADGSASGQIAGYHHTERNFVEQGATAQYPALGVELEVYAPQRVKAVKNLRKEFKPKDLYLERDGSLDENKGFEIITQPLGKALWAETAPKLLNNLKKSKVVGYNHPDRDKRYGIHINVHRRGLSALQEARIMLFLTAEENLQFVQAIAQRRSIYRARMDMCGLHKSDQKVYNISPSGRNYEGKIMGNGKFCPVNFHEDVAEFRIFQSTLMETSFMKNLEFIWALIEWTSTNASTGTSWMHTDFCKWLGTRQQVEKDYPNLMAYLRKPKYITKFSDGPIENRWVDLIRAPVRSSLVVETDEDIELAA